MISLGVPRKEIGTRAEARTKEVERALAMHADYILFLDSDQTMPDTAVQRMLEVDEDVVVLDTPPHDSNVSLVFYNPDGSVAYCTIACSLIKMNVFEFMPKPWFSSQYDFIKGPVKNGKYTFERLDKSKDNNVGEDIYFIRKAIENGVTIGVVGDLRCNHYQLDA